MSASVFHISPNPASLYRTASVDAVIAKTEYVLSNALGITCVIGDYGLGKSILCRYLHQTFDTQENYVTDLITTPVFASEFAMVKQICQDFGLPARRSLSAQMNELQGFLLDSYRAGRKVLLFVDEANRLKGRDLEILRACLNWETDDEKLISIALFGSPQLRELILSAENRPLYSRVIAPSTLDPMTPDEVRGLIETRQAHYKTRIPFAPGAHEKLWTLSNGVPRACLKIAGVANHLRGVVQAEAVTADLIEAAAKESSLED